MGEKFTKSGDVNAMGGPSVYCKCNGASRNVCRETELKVLGFWQRVGSKGVRRYTEKDEDRV